MASLWKRNRQLINRTLPSYRQRRYFSPTADSTDGLIETAVQAHVRGRLLDIGCGDMPYQELFASRANQVDTLDREARTEGVTYLGDVQAMTMISDGSYDSAVCLSVLEHVPDPVQALQEIARILKPGGVLLLSVPHLSRLHEEPHDYFRYTRYGLRALLERTGLQVVELTPAGGLFSFLGHQVSTMFLCSLWHLPVIRQIAYQANKWLLVKPCVWLDRLLDKRKIFALGYVCVARKGEDQAL